MANNNQQDDWQEIDDWKEIGAQPAAQAPTKKVYPDTGEGRVQQLLDNKDPFQLPNGMRIPMPIPIPAVAGGGIIPKAASTVGGAIRTGAAEGALQGAGQSMNEDTLASRAGHTALGGVTGGAVGGVAGLIGKGAQASKDARLFAKPYEAAKWAQGQYDDALTKLQELIRGNTDVVEQGVKGKPIKANLEQIRKAAPELKSNVDEIYGRSQPIMEDVVESGFGPVSKRVGDVVPGEDALTLKRALDDENWKMSGSMDPIHKAKDRELGSLAGGLRKQINDISPEVGQANELLSQRAFPLKKLLEAKDTAESPMSRLLSENSAPTLANADDLLGTNLGEAAHRMDTAKWLQLDPRKLLTLSALPEAAKTASRGAGLAAEGISRAAPEGSKEAILQALIALQNRKTE